MRSQFSNMMSSSIFWHCFVSLVKFSYWSKFHVNFITGSGVLAIFFYKGLTRNLEIGNTLVWVCPISGDWGKKGIPNLAGKICYWMLQNARITAFTISELLRKKQLGGKIAPSRLGLIPQSGRSFWPLISKFSWTVHLSKWINIM